MHPFEVPRITPGMTLAVAEPDYCYGTGTALLIVREITVDHRLLPSLEWVLLHCERLRPEGGAALGPFSPLVRVTALAAAVRRTGWLPGLEQQHAAAAIRHRGDLHLDQEREHG